LIHDEEKTFLIFYQHDLLV